MQWLKRKWHSPANLVEVKLWYRSKGRVIVRQKTIHKMVALAMVVGMGLLLGCGCAANKKYTFTLKAEYQDQDIKPEA